MILDNTKVNRMGNQVVEAIFKTFAVNTTDYASTEQRNRKGFPSHSVLAFNWPTDLIIFHSMVSHKKLHSCLGGEHLKPVFKSGIP